MALPTTFEVEIIDRELVTVDLYVIDRISGATSLGQLLDLDIQNPLDGEGLLYNASTGKWENGSIVATVDPAKFVQGEIPTPNPPVSEGDLYTTASDFVAGTLEVFLNGLKLLASDFTTSGNNQFSIAIDTIVGDVVTVNYIKP